jgi:DtxR family Mn-dependent transcriptional regulator
MRSRSIEDYIKIIYRLEQDHERATTQRIAEQLKVRMASVTGMIKHLAAEGYLKHKPYYGVKLTEKGRRLALTMIRRHRLIELFLHQTLGLDWDEVHDDAEVLEHAVSDRLIERISRCAGGHSTSARPARAGASCTSRMTTRSSCGISRGSG